MNIVSQLKKIFTRKAKIIVVLGQTSTGKSDIAVEIAKKFNGEVISADSRQVYRGMDLGSGKITKEEMQGVPHHMLDVTDPNEVFDVTQFQKQGTKVINDILTHKKIPIICGGTGFYIDALVYQTQFTSVQPNKKLREKLELLSLSELQNILRKTSPREYKKIDINNPVRIIRALEIIDELGYIPKIKKKNPYNILFIGMTLPKEKLNKRIYKRIINRLEQGMLEEVYTLLKSGLSHKRLQSLGLEYRFMSKHILGEISYDEMIDQLYHATVQFAKRQKTWFKRNKNIHWFDSLGDKNKIFNSINTFLDT